MIPDHSAAGCSDLNQADLSSSSLGRVAQLS